MDYGRINHFRQSRNLLVAPILSMILFQVIVNNAMRTIGLQHGKPIYNPGLLTHCLIVVPYCVYAIYQAYDFFLWHDWVLSLLFGVDITALLMQKAFGRLAAHKSETRIIKGRD